MTEASPTCDGAPMLPPPVHMDCLDVPFEAVFDYWDAITKSGNDSVAIRALTLYDRYFLLVQILGRTDMLDPWLYARCREVERAPDGFLDLWAREHYKSTIITYAGVIQEVMHNPDITVGIFSHTKGIARAFLRQIKIELESNIKLKKIFPDILFQDPEAQSPLWSIDNGIVVKRKTNPAAATIEAHGLVDGMPTGKHFALLVYDDVVTKESVGTPEQIAKTTECWELSDNLGAAGGRKWHIGTRYSYADTYEAIIKRGAVVPRIYPATSDGTITGVPVLITQEAWDAKVIAQGEATVSCQMLQNPLAGHQRMFNTEDLQVYEVRPATLAVYILCDPARSKKSDSDNTAIVVIGVDYAANKYLLDGFNHKMDLMERWTRFANLYVKWTQMTGVQIVHMGYESYGAQADLDYFTEQMKITGVRFPVKELAWPRDGQGSKIDRVQRLGPDFRTHKFFLPHPTDDNNITTNQRRMLNSGYEYRVSKSIRRKDENNMVYDLVDQFKLQVHYFPFGGKKDLVDAASRIYDMEPRSPNLNEPSYAEPEFC